MHRNSICIGKVTEILNLVGIVTDVDKSAVQSHSGYMIRDNMFYKACRKVQRQLSKQELSDILLHNNLLTSIFSYTQLEDVVLLNF